MLSFATIYDRKYFVAVFCAILAFLFHKSSIFFLLVLLLYCIAYGGFIIKNRNMMIILSIICLVAVLIKGSEMINLLLLNDFGDGRYAEYADYKGTGFGIFVIIQYLPVFVILLLTNRKEMMPEDKRWWNISFVMAIAGFAIAILGYSNGMLTRAAIYFSSSFVFFIPSYILQLNVHRSHNTNIIKTFTLGYYMFLYIVTLGGIYIISELGPFKMV